MQIFEIIAEEKCVIVVTHDPDNLINTKAIYEITDGKLTLKTGF